LKFAEVSDFDFFHIEEFTLLSGYFKDN